MHLFKRPKSGSQSEKSNIDTPNINSVTSGIGKKTFDSKNIKKLVQIPESLIRIIEQVGSFSISLAEYLVHKLDEILHGIKYLTLKNVEMFINLKFQAVSRMIWSRGRISTNIRYVFIVFFAWTIFLAGGVFQGKLIEKTEGSQSAFISSQSILLERATAATFEGETELLSAPVEHTVEKDETLDSIAKKYGITIESIKFANDLTYSTVKEGKMLMIPPVEGTLHTVVKGDTLESLARKYKVPSQTIVDFNYIDAPYTLDVDQIITIPDAELPKAERYYAGKESYDTSAYGILPSIDINISGSGEFVWPLSGVISQGFHRYHPAIDIANNSGDILATDKGTVVRAGWWVGGFGNAIQIDHGNGYVTTYAHMSSLSVSSGEEVEKGQKIGTVGSTGRSSGPHLHFVVQKDGKYVNPMSVL